MMTVTEDVGPSKKRKPYTHLACAGCKSKHIKCDGGKPSCQSCVSKKLECHYREERNMRRSSSKSQIKEEEFKDQLLQLQQEVEYWKSRYYTLIQLTQTNPIMGNVPHHSNHQDEFSYPNPIQLNTPTKVQHSHKKGFSPQKGNHQPQEEIPNYKPQDKPLTSKSPSTGGSYHSIPDRQKSYSYGDIPPLFSSDLNFLSPNYMNSVQHQQQQQQPPVLNPPIVRSRSQSQYEDNMILDNNQFLSDANRSNSVPNSLPQTSSYPYNRSLSVQPGMMGLRTAVLDRFVDPFDDSINMIHKSNSDSGYDSNHFSQLVDAKPVYNNKGIRETNTTPLNGELFKFQVNDYNMLYHSPIQGYIYREDYQGMGYMSNPSSIH
jgi:hypothetical protein